MPENCATVFGLRKRFTPRQKEEKKMEKTCLTTITTDEHDKVAVWDC